MFNISIIGCGWLGSKTANYLSLNGYKVKGSATNKNSLLSLNEKSIDGYLVKIAENLSDSIINRDFFKCDVLIISLKPNRQNDDNGLFEKQIKTIGEIAKDHNIKKIIFWSSTSVYGDDNTIVNEKTELNPSRPSGKSLKNAEHYLLNQTEFSTVILRLGGLIGYDRNPYETVKLKRKAGSLHVPVNLVHADDVILITQKVIEESHSNVIYNTVSDAHPLRILYYENALKKLNTIPDNFNIESNNNFKIVDNSKIKKELRYSFLVSDPKQIYAYKALLSQ